MIAKAVFGRRFDPLLAYISEGGHCERSYLGYMTHAGHRLGGVYYANLAADTPERAAREMAFIAKTSQRVQKPVMQLVISLHPAESNHKDKAQRKRLAEAAQQILVKLGLGDHQAVYAIHLEKDHMHCHVAANRVKHDGTVWPMWRSAERIQAACHSVAHEMGYMVVPKKTRRTEATQEVGRPTGWTGRQLKSYEKTGAIPTATRANTKAQRARLADEIRPAMGDVLAKCLSWAEAINELTDHGFSLALYQKSSRRGLQIVRQDGLRVASSAIARDFSLLALERRWGPLPNIVCEAKAQPLQEPTKRTAAESLASLDAPNYVKDAHHRLSTEYRQLTEPVLAERSKALMDARQSERLEIDEAKRKFGDEIRTLRPLGLRRKAMRFMISVASQELRTVVAGIRQKYQAKREQIKDNHGVPAWLDFLVGKAQKLVQDAITILNWLRRHLDRRPLAHRLIPINGMRTPPEYFEHLGFRATVTDNGTIEYEDELKRQAFADRGEDIVVYTNEEGRPKWKHMGAALKHGDAKWGGCSSPTEERDGNLVFREYAASASARYDTQLDERFEFTEPAPAVGDKELPGKRIVAITPVRDRARGR